MLILVPVLFLLLPAIAILLLRWMRPDFHYAWLIAALASFFSWLSLCLLRFRLPTSYTLMTWHIGGLVDTSPGLLLDYSSWAYSLCISTLILSVILTATARAQYQQDAFSWAGSMAFGGLGMMSVLASNPISLLLSWTSLDLINLGILLSSAGTSDKTNRSLIAFSAQAVGNLFVMGATLANHAPGLPITFETMSGPADLFLLMGIALRLGVFPLHLPFSMEPRLRRGVGSLLRLIPVASTLMLLGRLPELTLPGSWRPILQGLAALSALYCALMWINSQDEVEGRPYWIIASAALALACVLQGNPQSSLAWGIGALLSGGLMFLYSARSSRLWYLWAFGIWGLSGLPYSPAASGWDGLLGAGSSIGLGAVFLVSQVLLLLGYARHAIQIRDPLDGMEPWVKTIYPLGLAFIVITMGLVTFAGWHGSRSLGMAWPGLIGVTLVITGLVTRILRPSLASAAGHAPIVEWANPQMLKIFQGITAFLRLDWLYQWLWQLYRLLNRFIAILSGILEGDGGVLWALLLLTLLITLIQGGM